MALNLWSGPLKRSCFLSLGKADILAIQALHTTANIGCTETRVSQITFKIRSKIKVTIRLGLLAEPSSNLITVNLFEMYCMYDGV